MGLLDHDSTGMNKTSHLDCVVCLQSEVNILRQERDEFQNQAEKAKDDVFEHLILLMQGEFGYGNGAIRLSELRDFRVVLDELITTLNASVAQARGLSSLLGKIEVRD